MPLSHFHCLKSSIDRGRQHGDGAVREDAAIAVDERTAAAIDLARGGTSCELLARLDDIVHGRYLPRRTKGQQAAMCVHREGCGRVVAALRSGIHGFDPRATSTDWRVAFRSNVLVDVPGEVLMCFGITLNDFTRSFNSLVPFP